MAVRETVEIDLERVDRLIQEREEELEPKHRASIEYRAVAGRHVAGGVASSWQASPPHAIFIDRGERDRLWDIDGNEYVDYHLGYGAMVIGHAHPAVVECDEKQHAVIESFATQLPLVHDANAVGGDVLRRGGFDQQYRQLAARLRFQCGEACLQRSTSVPKALRYIRLDQPREEGMRETMS